jgi:hypothetical protein
LLHPKGRGARRLAPVFMSALALRVPRQELCDEASRASAVSAGSTAPLVLPTGSRTADVLLFLGMRRNHGVDMPIARGIPWLPEANGSARRGGRVRSKW